LSEADIADRAVDWQDAFEGLIPVDRLNDAFISALRDHTSTFPVNAFEILAAWQILKAAEDVEAKKITDQNRAANSVQFCKQKEGHLNEYGEVEIVDPFDRSKNITMPCPNCRPNAHMEARARHVEKSGGLELPPIQIAESFVTKKANHISIPETPLEIIAKARNEVGQEILRDPNAGELREAQEQLTRIWHYLYGEGER